MPGRAPQVSEKEYYGHGGKSLGQQWGASGDGGQDVHEVTGTQGSSEGAVDTAGQSGIRGRNMEDTERGNLGRGAWDSKEEEEKTNPPAQEASDGLELQWSLEQEEARKACLEGGEE